MVEIGENRIEIKTGNHYGVYLYFIRIFNSRSLIFSEEKISEYLYISVDEYKSLLRKYGAFGGFNCPDMGDYYFFDKDNCKRFIDEVIEPHLVMKKLIGE